MVAVVIEVKTRPSENIAFMDPEMLFNRSLYAMSSWPGFIKDSFEYSDDNLTQTRVMTWETFEHFTSPVLSPEQQEWSEKNKKWYSDHNFTINYIFS